MSSASDNADDGGPAFPQVDGVSGYRNSDGDHQIWGTNGMSLRDYFAARAMHSLLMCAMSPFAKNVPPNAETASFAYAMADAMLAERAK